VTDREELRKAAHGWDEVASEYAANLYHELDHKPFDRALLAEFAVMVDRRDLPVFDLGCGPGHISNHLGGLGLRPHGLDLSPSMIEIARRLHPELVFEVGDMMESRWPPDTLGGVIALYSLINLTRPDVPVVLGRLAEGLVGGGPLLVAVHHGEGESHEVELFGRPVPMTVTLFTADEMGGYLAGAGFLIVETEARGPYPGEYQSARVYVLATRAASR